MVTFSDLNINNWLIRRCEVIGVKHPTPIQANCIPEILNGKDCIGAAKTGSGKTLAFALPILHTWLEDRYAIYALILTPTRELAHQIGELFKILGKPLNLRCCVIVGGMDMIQQGLELSRRPHIVVATPGRLADHIESCNTFSLSLIKYLVFDEADRLLSGHFNEQIKTIFNTLPKKRQNLLFSATITDSLETVKKATRNEVFVYEAPSETATVHELEQHYVLCPQYVRDGYFVEVLRTYRADDSNGSIMIFTESCGKCQALSIMLNEVGFENVALHGMLAQKERLAALAKFKSHVVKILIATDVASRGLDIPKVQLVLNHILPETPTDYIHRVGRTARAGRKGQAISLIIPEDIPTLQEIEQHINVKMTEYKIDDKEVAKIFLEVSVTKSEAYLKMEAEQFYEKRLINKRKNWILAGLDPDKEEKKLLKKRKLKNNKRNNAEQSNLDTEEKLLVNHDFSFLSANSNETKPEEMVSNKRDSEENEEELIAHETKKSVNAPLLFNSVEDNKLFNKNCSENQKINLKNLVKKKKFANNKKINMKRSELKKIKINPNSKRVKRLNIKKKFKKNVKIKS